MDFEKICMMFQMQEPFYGILLSSMNRTPTKSLPTLGVGRSGSVFKLMYNPDFIAKLSVDETIELLKHECLHLALNHFTIWTPDEDTPGTARLRNAACDFEVNSYLKESVISRLKGLLPSDYGWDKMLGTREYYRLLLAKKDEREKTPRDQSAPNREDDGTGIKCQNEAKEMNEMPEALDSHSEWPDCDSQEERDVIRNAIDDLVVYAAEETDKSGGGGIPDAVRKRIKVILDRKCPKPAADWKRFLRRYIGNEYSEQRRQSHKRISRRFPDAAGSRHQRKSRVLVAVDTSGSISMPEYVEFFQQIRTLKEKTSFHVVECDTAIRHEYDYRGRPNLTVHGGGGTAFHPVTAYFNERRREYDALIYFTDGEAPIPVDTPKDTLWVISSKGDQNSRDRYRVNGASVVFIPKKTDNKANVNP